MSKTTPNLTEEDKRWLSQSQLNQIKNKIEDFRKQIVGLDKKVPLLDGSLKRYINTEEVMLTLFGKCCIII
jgi:uncharacterized protein YeeX (DUF496 family)